MYRNGYVCVGSPIPKGGCDCKCDITIINNIDINIKKLIVKCDEMSAKLDAMEKVLTREDVEYLQEQTLRANLEVKNHDIKIVRMLESMGATNDVDYVEEVLPVKALEQLPTETYEVKKGLFGKEKVVKTK